MRRYTLIGLVCLVGCLVACQALAPPSTPRVDLPLTTPGGNSTPASLSLNDYGRLSRDAVLLQLEFEPTFGEPRHFLPYGRLPEFSLLADGRLIYKDDSQPPNARIAHLTPEEASALLTFAKQKFSHLQSFTGKCQDQADGTTLCVEDGSYTILRLRHTDKSLHEIKIYNSFANDPAAFEALVQNLVTYTQPHSQPYFPERAALIFQRDESIAPLQPEPFPLNGTYLPPASLKANLWAVPLSAEDIGVYLASRQDPASFATFQSGKTLYQAYFVPWLPGNDYSAEITTQFPPGQPRPTPDPALSQISPLKSCPEFPDQPLPIGNLRLVYVQDGNLFVKENDLSVPIGELTIPSGLPAVQLTRSGLVDDFVLSPDGAMAYFSYRGQKGPELRAIDLFTADDFPLAEPFTSAQRLQLHTPSDDGAWLAFSVEEDAANASLWASQVNGAGIKSLVTVDQLKALHPDLLNHGAFPINLQWIPGTHQLIYDAYPTGEGINIYLPDSLQTVDVDSGLQQPYLPGQLIFSPDGKHVAIQQTTNLLVAEAGGNNIRPSGLNYCAVGMGESYFFPPVAWQDAHTLLATHLPICEINLQNLDDTSISISSLEIGASPTASQTTNLLKTVQANPFSLNFAAGGQVFSYWTTSNGKSAGSSPASDNLRALHIARLDGEEDVIYAIEDEVSIINWSPDAQHFIYTATKDDETYRVFLGSPCRPAVELPSGLWPSVRWLNGEWFILEFIDYNQHRSQLFLGSVDGTISPLLETSWETYPQWQAILLP